MPYVFRCLVQHLPLEIQTVLHEVRTGVRTPSFIRFKGFRIDDELPATPNNGRPAPDKKTFVADGILLAVTQLMGTTPYGFSDEKCGNLINQITPAPNVYADSSAGSASNLGFHTECAHLLGERPDYVNLFCLRKDHEGKAATTIADIRRCLPSLVRSRWMIEALRRPVFQIKVPTSFGQDAWSAPVAVLDGDLTLPTFTYDANGIRVVGNDKEGELALEHLDLVLNMADVVTNIYLEPGDLLIIPNRYVAHGRTNFTALFDGLDRWLIRAYSRESHWPSRGLFSEDKHLVLDMSKSTFGYAPPRIFPGAGAI